MIGGYDFIISDVISSLPVTTVCHDATFCLPQVPLCAMFHSPGIYCMVTTPLTQARVVPLTLTKKQTDITDMLYTDSRVYSEYFNCQIKK